ncbi:MAG: hypothetical protein R3F54_12610 [Alphaproteobacteria bacterium]
MNPVGGAPPVAPSGGQQQATTSAAGQNGLSAEEQAAFNQAIQDFAVGELLTDHFVVEQPIIDEINKESAK